MLSVSFGLQVKAGEFPMRDSDEGLHAQVRTCGGAAGLMRESSEVGVERF